MEKVEKKSNNTVMTIVIVVLALLVIGLGGFIGYDKLINKTDTESTTTKNESNESKECDCPEVVEEEKGKCPLTKFDDSFSLTDEAREEIVDSIVATYSYKRESISKERLRLTAISKNGYHINVVLEGDPTIGDNDAFFYVSQVNGKYKVIGGGGSGDVKEEYDRMIETLDGICR